MYTFEVYIKVRNETLKLKKAGFLLALRKPNLYSYSLHLRLNVTFKLCVVLKN